MPFERQQRIVVRHPVPVVNHADHPLPAPLCLDSHDRGAGVQGIFEQFLDDGCRTLHYLARRDPVRHRFRQYSYPAHTVLVLIALLVARERSDNLQPAKSKQKTLEMNKAKTTNKPAIACPSDPVIHAAQTPLAPAIALPARLIGTNDTRARGGSLSCLIAPSWSMTCCNSSYSLIFI